MSDYTPPYKITDKALMLVADISEKVGRITQRSELDAKPHLRKNNKIKSIHSSLAIEANSLTLGEVRDVIDGKLVFGAAREIQEVKNAYAAYEEVGSVDIYSIKELKRLHGIMTKYLTEGSGEFRCGEEGVFARYDFFHIIKIKRSYQRVHFLIAFIKRACSEIRSVVIGDLNVYLLRVRYI